MGNSMQELLKRFSRNRRLRRRVGGVLVVLAAVVALGVAWGLHMTGVAMTADVSCGLEEHTHTDECYDEDGNLTCGLEEHTHTVDCLDATDSEASDDDANGDIYEAKDDSSGITVTVSAPDGALPEGAELSVELLEEDTDEYSEAAEAVGITDGIVMAALDISFSVDGVEVEPSETVTVTIDASEAVSDEVVDISSMVVSHIEELGDGVEAVVVADATDDTDGTVDTDAVTAEFAVEGFSTFTISWSANINDSTAISTTCYFSSDGESYSVNDKLGSSGLIVGYANEVDFDDDNSLLAVDGYTLSSATLTYTSNNRSVTVEGVDSVKATYNWSSGVWTYQYTIDNGSTWSSFDASSASISLYYVAVADALTGDLTITDDISNTGSLVATYSGSENLEGGTYYYKWYKLINTDTGEYEELSGEVESSLAVYIDGARETYKVELWALNGTEALATSASYQVPYYDQLQNGSFEYPSITGNAQLTNGLYSEMVWLTTGLGSLNTDREAAGQDIEIVNASGSGSSYNETTAAKGDQYAELNCETAGTLYQDVMTIPGVSLYWQAAHEARETSGVDKMCVIIVDAEFASKYITTQAHVDAVYNAAVAAGLTDVSRDGSMSSVTFEYTVDGETVLITFWLMASDSDGWEYYYDTYEVPEGQYLTRFLFGAISCCSGNNTVGNLLDDVSFSQTPPTNNKSGNLTVTKTVEGVDDGTVILKGTYTFDVKDSSGSTVGTVSLPTVDATTSQSYYWTYTLTGLTAGTYTVVETCGNAPSGYEYVSTTSTAGRKAGETGVTFTSGNVLVKNSETATVGFTNTYKSSTVSVTLKKVDSDDDSTVLSGATFTLTQGNTTIDTYITSDEDGTVSLGSLTVGSTYTLTETEAPDGYNLLTEPITFTVKSDGVTFATGTDSDIVSASYDSTSGITITVENTAGRVLPNTGGTGTILTVVAGCVLVAGASVMLATKRRRSQAR